MIRILDKQTADKIAAGEVIERPVSIVKELVENSIDAGATSIVIEIKKGGKSYIRVTDNGIGIPAEDTEKAFLRHATSKIRQAADLDAIETLGFRGEALASICAVTRTELLTKTKNEKTGTRLIIHGGQIISDNRTGCPDGTTFIVTDLFYNTPARLKFMKNDGAESSMIIDLISQMALAYSHISFRLINNGNTLFSTTGDGNRLNIIARIFPSINIKDMIPVDMREGNMSLKGYISTPAMSRTSRSGQIFFVNGRVINSRVMDRGLADGYRERLFEGRHPVAFLFLDVDAGDLDVNIHPNKKEVRFNREKETENFISEAVKKALGTGGAVVRAANIFRDKGSFEGHMAKEEQIVYKNIMSTNQRADGQTAVSAEPAARPPETVIETPHMVFPQQDAPVETPVMEPEPDLSVIIDPPVIRPFDFDDLTLRGIIFDTYIMAVDEDNFYLIDQHAAHERVFYEKLVSQYEAGEKLRQPLLMPILMNVDVSAAESEDRWAPLLDNMGFTIENFGQTSYRVSEIPTFMEIGEAEDFLKDFIDGAGEKFAGRNKVVIDKLIMRSCKSAVKGGDRLSEEEAAALIKDLKRCINPFSCPHGRPTFIKLSKYEIERLFKRA